MIIIYFLLFTSTTAFIFLPQFLALLASPNQQIPQSIINLINLRLYLISFIQRRKFTGKISKLYVYPIKSVSYISPSSWELDEFGFKHDRQYMLAFWDSTQALYQPYTQRNAPKLSLVEIDFNKEENWFKFTYPTDGGKLTSFKLPMNITQDWIAQNSISDEHLKTDLWGVKFQSINIGKALPDDFKIAMGLNRPGTTLLTSLSKKVISAHPQELKEQKSTLFHDYYPLHFLSQTLVDELNHRISEQGSTRQVEAKQFRPNIVITDQKIDMDYWYDIKLNGKQIYIVQKTPRCNIGNVILSAGQFDKTNIVTRSLRQYRRIDTGDINGSFLGNYGIHKEYGYSVKVGDEIWLGRQRISSYEKLL
ncbi:putative secreted protein [Wickerhamomyces ciferrii]|uniref:Secreted protein n=1 Tax=Wickerhamomyces ciferrii (strain ATCC 14091 / BCRC 22168 / CBS 111 / JCM 3599 / NBRC 0793 / NRRL Y-1031 F-60-10) TaxID=1206466 RepID=K0KFP0_WICCF|nr:uncharacterized protein BN7_3515 [Wickerhamomyces ciferrii]CCH43960.1 putative secreted protein [Wickerhamomyces ciferrii]